MDSNFKPGKRPGRSLQAKLDDVAETPKADDTDSFRTPEEAAAAEDVAEPAQLVEQTDGNADARDKGQSSQPKSPKTPSGWREKLKLHWPPGNKEYIVAGVLVLLIAGGVACALTHQNAKPTIAPKPVKPKVVKPLTVPSTLTGLPVDPSVNKRPVTGVMIENSTDARPQSGLGQAGVVFEAIAEGGITRFLALFQDTAPDNVGPIRSARPYYLQWALGFDAGYAHVGGSPDALASIKAWNVRDLDQFANGGSYHRVSTRPAPHNVYTSIAALNQLEAKKGYLSSTYTGFLRKKEAPSKQPTAKTINLAISGPIYNAHYDYVAATNSYNRSEGGAPQIDANTNTQISPKVVIALVMPYGLAADQHHSVYNTIGSGPVYVFQDGIVATGQWAKSGNTNQFTFTDAAGKPIKLNPGQTWLTAVGSASNVASAP